MKFSRRAEGIKESRAVFKRSREDTRSLHHVRTIENTNIYLIKNELHAFVMAPKTTHFSPSRGFIYEEIFSINQGESFVKIYVCFITYKDHDFLCVFQSRQ